MSITFTTNLKEPYIVIKPDVDFNQYLQWCDEDSRAELLDGELIMNSPASLIHEELQAFLSFLLTGYVRQNDLGKVLGPNYTIHFNDKNGLCPDLMFVSNKYMYKVKQNYIDGAPDFVLEILSPSDRPQYMEIKKNKYLENGVMEYWLIDPKKETLTVYNPDKNEKIYTGEIVKSLVINNFWIKLDWIWQEPLPNPLQCLNEILQSSI